MVYTGLESFIGVTI